jgi:hypothetical protein
LSSSFSPFTAFGGSETLPLHFHISSLLKRSDREHENLRRLQTPGSHLRKPTKTKAETPASRAGRSRVRRASRPKWQNLPRMTSPFQIALKVNECLPRHAPFQQKRSCRSARAAAHKFARLNSFALPNAKTVSTDQKQWNTAPPAWVRLGQCDARGGNSFGRPSLVCWT